MAGEYKLTYFNIRGRAEPMRMLFALAGVQYEDIRVDRDHWLNNKSEYSAPFGQLPLLEVDGIKLCQSVSCSRFLAKRFNLLGKTDLDQARGDMIVDCCEDMVRPAIVNRHSDKDDAAKEAGKKKFREEQLPVSLAYLEKLLESNNGGEGYFVGSQLTWTDVYFANVITWVGRFSDAVEPLQKFPKLEALEKRVNSHPMIAEWIAKRPVTD